MSSEWKSEQRVRWTPHEDQFLMEQISRNPRETHMDLGRKIMNHPLMAGRTLTAIEQRIGWANQRREQK